MRAATQFPVTRNFQITKNLLKSSFSRAILDILSTVACRYKSMVLELTYSLNGCTWFFSKLKPVTFWHLTTWRPFDEIGERSSVIVRFIEHIILFSLLYSSFSPQILAGFVSFLFPKLPDGLRAAYLKVHVFFGVFIFMMAIGSCLLGVNEKLSFNPKWVLVNWQF